MPAFDDTQVAANAHYYCAASQFLPDPIGVVSVPYCHDPDQTAFTNLASYSAQLNVPTVVSEFGANDADAESSPPWPCPTQPRSPAHPTATPSTALAR